LVTPAIADPAQDAAFAPLKNFVASINANNAMAAVAECATNATITDEFAPFHWTNTACRTWADALFAGANAAGQTDEVMTLGAPVVVSVEGDAAYVSVAGHLAFKVKGKPGSEDGMFAAVMTKVAGEWKIVSWAWATTKL
jgi:hypothetical protein